MRQEQLGQPGAFCTPVIYIGKISYSLYIWHWPVLVLSRHMPSSGHAMSSLLCLLALTFALGMASYHVIERFTRHNSKAVPFILGAFLASLAYAWHLSVADLREDISFYTETIWNGQLYNVSPRPEFSDAILKRMQGITIHTPDKPQPEAYAAGGIQHLYGKITPEIVLFGDSHALMWAGLLDEIAKELGRSISFYAAEGTPTFFKIPVQKEQDALPSFNAEEKYAFDLGRLNSLADWKPRVVLIAAKWSDNTNLKNTLDLLNLLGKIGAKVLLIEQPPPLFFGDKNAPLYLSYMGLAPSGAKQYLPGLNRREYGQGRDLIRQISDLLPYCDVIPVADLYLNDTNVWVLDGSEVLYIDDDHLSQAGTWRAKQVILRNVQDCFISAENP